MGWLIIWLLLALLCGLAVFTRRGRRHPPTDETLITELLGPSEPPTVRVLPPPAPQPQKEDEPSPAPQPQEDEPSPAPAALPAGEGGWLETQLALITAWSERMQKQIASSQADPDPWHCIAITTKGSQCKLPAEPGDTKCAIHGGHPDRLPVAKCAGGPVGDVNFRNRVWWPAVEAADIRKFLPRIMRHTAASWLVMDGVPLYDVQALLGHESFATTQRNAHLAPDAHSRVIESWSRRRDAAVTHGAVRKDVR